MAARTTTVGRLMFDQAVPQQFREGLDDATPLGSDQVKQVLQRVAEKDPTQYRDISHRLLQLGAKASTEVEASFTMKDLESPIDKVKMLEEVDRKEQALHSDKNLNDAQRERELVKLYGNLSNEMPGKIYGAAHALGSNLAKMVASGARGNKGQLNSNIGADWLMLDPNDRPVPVPIKHSYAEGLDPAEYFASSYGTRSGLISTKFSTADSGFLSKQLSAATNDMVVTEKDCGTHRGILSTPDDKDNIGAILSKPAGGHPIGTILHARTLKDLEHKGIKDITVRSPLTCTARGGLCSTCAGIRERGHLPPLMDNLGLAASSSLAEPLSQGMLSKKHSGGVASSSGKTQSAFQQINNLVQVPEVFPEGATVARRDGKITRIEKAPQGGHDIDVDGERHYVGPDLELHHKVGDQVEAGDTLSSGVPNPADIVRHKGVGEGRLYFVNAMRKTFQENGLPVNRRNLEVIARSLVNHVRITHPDGLGDHLPDDIVEYNGLEPGFKPEGTQKLHPNKAVGQYLHSPALHYTVGTRITSRVAKQLEQQGETEIEAGTEHPGFEPDMQRVMDVPSFRPDWMSQFGGSYIKDRLLKNVHRGDSTSNIHGTSFLPGLAVGTEFGKPLPGVVGY